MGTDHSQSSEPSQSTPPAPEAAVSILAQRRIEAQFAMAILDQMQRHLPREQALGILRDTVLALAREAGAELARARRTQRTGTGALAEATAQARSGEADLVGLADAIPAWQKDDALEIEWIERTGRRLSFDVTRCRYAEMYRALGIPELGTLLSCNRDGEFCSGYNPAIALSRPATIMQGAARCTFRYTLAPRGSGQQSEPT
jgi:hypothetical protein